MIIVHSVPCLCYSFENDLLLITHQYRLRSSGHQNFNLHLHSPVMPKIGFQYLKSLFSQNKLQFSSVIYFSIMIMHLFFCLLVSCIFWGFFHSEDILHMWTERVFFFTNLCWSTGSVLKLIVVPITCWNNSEFSHQQGKMKIHWNPVFLNLQAKQKLVHEIMNLRYGGKIAVKQI